MAHLSAASVWTKIVKTFLLLTKVKRSVSQIIYSEMVEWYILNNSVKKKKGRNNRDDDDESAEPAQFRIDGGTYENERSIISYRPRS